MLVLSRKRNERVIVGNLDSLVVELRGPVVITVIAIYGNTVRLGIEAPRDVPVHREELADRLVAERTAAAS